MSAAGSTTGSAASATIDHRIRLGSIAVMALALVLLSTWRSYVALMVAAGLMLALVVASRGLKGVVAGASGQRPPHNLPGE